MSGYIEQAIYSRIEKYTRFEEQKNFFFDHWCLTGKQFNFPCPKKSCVSGNL